ncbi:MAG: tetratricopeptide repeat protein [Candidatus Aminicenantes bacterium]|nr:tetratricopeptide repeat protein [Candidatus Aminicenantes bacterium]
MGKGRLAGKVIDDEGKPVVSARIVLKFIKSPLFNGLIPSWRDESAVFETATDKKGEWMYQGLAGGIWEVRALKDGYHSSSRQVEIRQLSANPHVELTLQRLKGGAYSIAAGLLEKANELYAIGNLDEAVGAYREYLEQDPEAVMVMLSLGQCLEQTGQLYEAIREFQSIVDLTSANPRDREIEARALAGIGDCAFKKGDRETAIGAWKAAVEKSPTSENVAANLAEVLFSAGEDDEAVSYFRKALEIAPARQDIRLGLVNVLLHRGEMEKARGELNTIIKLGPRTPSADQARKILVEISDKKKPLFVAG